MKSDLPRSPTTAPRPEHSTTALFLHVKKLLLRHSTGDIPVLFQLEEDFGIDIVDDDVRRITDSTVSELVAMLKDYIKRAATDFPLHPDPHVAANRKYWLDTLRDSAARQSRLASNTSGDDNSAAANRCLGHDCKTLVVPSRNSRGKSTPCEEHLVLPTPAARMLDISVFACLRPHAEPPAGMDDVAWQEIHVRNSLHPFNGQRMASLCKLGDRPELCLAEVADYIELCFRRDWLHPHHGPTWQLPKH